jgi:hypothetical protein
MPLRWTGEKPCPAYSEGRWRCVQFHHVKGRRIWTKLKISAPVLPFAATNPYNLLRPGRRGQRLTSVRFLNCNRQRIMLYSRKSRAARLLSSPIRSMIGSPNRVLVSTAREVFSCLSASVHEISIYTQEAKLMQSSKDAAPRHLYLLLHGNSARNICASTFQFTAPKWDGRGLSNFSNWKKSTVTKGLVHNVLKWPQPQRKQKWVSA